MLGRYSGRTAEQGSGEICERGEEFRLRRLRAGKGQERRDSWCPRGSRAGVAGWGVSAEGQRFVREAPVMVEPGVLPCGWQLKVGRVPGHKEVKGCKTNDPASLVLI